MADFVKELGTALQTAFRADASLRTILATPDGSTWAVEYGDQPLQFAEGISGVCRIYPQPYEPRENYEGSGRTAFMFIAEFALRDRQAKLGAKSVLQKGLLNIFRDHGAAILDTHLVDSASNRLGASGACTVTSLTDADVDGDPDSHVWSALIEIDLTHVTPLV